MSNYMQYIYNYIYCGEPVVCLGVQKGELIALLKGEEEAVPLYLPFVFVSSEVTRISFGFKELNKSTQKTF